MKRVAYISLSANSWQRAALLDSAINLAISHSAKVSFFQLYRGETSLIDFPLTSKLDYLRAKWQDNRVNREFQHDLFEIVPMKLRVKDEIEEIDALAIQVGVEETIVKTRDSKPCEVHSKLSSQHYAETYLAFYESAKSFFKEAQPDLVYIFNGRFYREKAFWHAAVDLGIEVNFIERFSPGWHDRYFEFKRPVHDISYRCYAMQHFMREFCGSHGITKAKEIASKWFDERAAGIGQTFTSRQNVIFQRNNSYSKQIVFFHSSEDELFTTELGSSKWADQISFLEDLIESLKSHPEILLVVRLHPNLAFKSPREIRRWMSFAKSILASNVKFLMQDSPVNSYYLIRSSDCVITFGSTIGVEATHMGKPSFLVSHAFHELLNVTKNVSNLIELMDSILALENLSPPDDLSTNTIPYGLFHAVGGVKFRHLKPLGEKKEQDQPFQFDGVSLGTLRIISLVRKIEGLLYRSLGLYNRYGCKC